MPSISYYQLLLVINPLGAMCTYIYMHVHAYRSPHMHTIQTSAYRTELPTTQDCGVNPYLLSSNKSRPHLFTYITAWKRQEGAVVMCE